MACGEPLGMYVRGITVTDTLRIRYGYSSLFSHSLTLSFRHCKARRSTSIHHALADTHELGWLDALAGIGLVLGFHLGRGLEIDTVLCCVLCCAVLCSRVRACLFPPWPPCSAPPLSAGTVHAYHTYNLLYMPTDTELILDRECNPGRGPWSRKDGEP